MEEKDTVELERLAGAINAIIGKLIEKRIIRPNKVAIEELKYANNSTSEQD